jgi:hypothetical protein
VYAFTLRKSFLLAVATSTVFSVAGFVSLGRGVPSPGLTYSLVSQL